MLITFAVVIRKLLSLPPRSAEVFCSLMGRGGDEWFAGSDPEGRKLGSGGGTVWLLEKAPPIPPCWGEQKQIVIHAGGQSRRLPAWAAMGKVLMPLPVWDKTRGYKIGQTLLDAQLPLLERLMETAPAGLNTLVASGDVLTISNYQLAISSWGSWAELDLVCLGVKTSREVASRHGVFVVGKERPTRLVRMLQKPSVAELEQAEEDGECLTDAGIWLLSDRALDLMKARSTRDGEVVFYDMYGEMGACIGEQPRQRDGEINDLRVAILPLRGAEFLHFGTTEDLLCSAGRLGIQEEVEKALNPVGKDLFADFVPVDESRWAVRPYGLRDAFRGSLDEGTTVWMGRSFKDWAQERGVETEAIEGRDDLQTAKLFPIVETREEGEAMLRWMLRGGAGREAWTGAERLSADELQQRANLGRFVEQQKAQSAGTLSRLCGRDDFYDADLSRVARLWVDCGLGEPEEPREGGQIARVEDAMLRSEIARLRGSREEAQSEEARAFSLLSEGVCATLPREQLVPRLAVEKGEVVEARSPVRIDIAGGWTDTPPYCMLEGGRVVNFAALLDGEAPLRARVRAIDEPVVRLRSVDMHAELVVKDYVTLGDYKRIGSPFSISRAALSLAGFSKENGFETLEEQLREFGGGIELETYSAVPAGSGLGTSSILSTTVLGALSKFCGFDWDADQMGKRALVLEQMLTTGGGWQDQFGGLRGGVKVLETKPGLEQIPTTRQLSPLEGIGEGLLYYTGLTRTAKNILGEIVRMMFLNQNEKLSILREMKQTAAEMEKAVAAGDMKEVGLLLRHSWDLNKRLDGSSNPEPVDRLCRQIDDLCLGYKLPGAGGGGFLYMIAKDEEAARRIRIRLSENRLNATACFRELRLSGEGLSLCARMINDK